MRITAGYARGILLDSPKRDAPRPATDAARLAVFSSLGDIVDNATILDIFAGTGAYGLEAASRGANDVVFVENSQHAFRTLKKNIVAVSKQTKSKFSPIFADCFKCSKLIGEKKFDVIFADPPYALLNNSDFEKKLANTFAEFSSVNTLIILEAPADYNPNDTAFAEFEIIKRLGKKSKGKPSQIIFKKLPLTQ